MDLRRYAPALLLLVLPLAPSPAPQARDLKPHTLEAFNSYSAKVEARLLAEVGSPDTFHRFDNIDARGRQRVLEELAEGRVYATNDFNIRENGEALDKAKDGKIHHWYAVIFIRGVTLAEVLELVQAYERHEEIFGPDVDRSGIVEHEANSSDFLVYYRLKKSVWVVTATLDTEHHVRYTVLDSEHGYSVSRSTSVREVEHAGDPSRERQKPEGEGRGYMWATNSYWRFMERDGGVYLECESVTLTNNLPLLLRVPLGWVVNRLPREALSDLLEATRDELLGPENQGAAGPGNR